MRGIRSNHLAITFLFISFILALTGCDRQKPVYKCSDRIGCVDLGPDDPIKIGVLQALSGKVAPLGIEQMRGLELAMDKFNSRILGHPIVLQIEDTGCTAEGGANMALRIIADPQTIAIIGTTCSGAAATVSKAMSDAGLTMISGNNSAPYLTSINGVRAPDWHPGFFRTSMNEESSGKAAAIYAYLKLGLRRAATINDGDIYTQGLTQGFDSQFRKMGGQIVLSTSINKGDQEMQPVLTAVVNSKAQILFFPLFQPEGNYILLGARKMEAFKNIALMSGGSLVENSFIKSVKSAGIGMLFIGPDTSSTALAQKLVRDYTLKYKTAPSAMYLLSAYDASVMLFDSIKKVAVMDKEGYLHIGRKELRETMYHIKNFDGASGSITCDRFGDCATPVFNVLRLDDPKNGVKGLQDNIMFTYKPER